MSLAITTNIAALISQRNVSRNNSNLSSALKKLSSGLRINSASDDASGMIIADSLKSQNLGLGQAVKNANDGVSMLQIADGALEDSVEIINTIKQKSIQAASDSQTDETRKAIQNDIDKLLEEFDIIAQTTSYNGQDLLSGNFTNRKLQVGASSGESIGISIASAESTKNGHINVSTVVPDQTGPIEMNAVNKSNGNPITIDVDLQYNNDAANGLGAMEDQINRLSEFTDIKAIAVVKSESNIISGRTGKNFKINGVYIGDISVKAGDFNSSLISAINDKTMKTGVTASTTTEGNLLLNSSDGRAIKVSGLIDPQVIDSEELTTLGHLKLIGKSNGQYDVTQNKSVFTEVPAPLTGAPAPLPEIPPTNVLNDIPTNTFITWNQPSGGSGGGISVTATHTINQGTTNGYWKIATDPDFVSNFSSLYPTLSYETLSSPPADISSLFSFSSPLPIGSKLLVLDVDHNEELKLTSEGTPLKLINQIPDRDDIPSSPFPLYDSSTGILIPGVVNSSNDVSIFDISNLSTIDVLFTGGTAGEVDYVGGLGSFAQIAIALPNGFYGSSSKMVLKESILPQSVINETKTLRLCDVDVTESEMCKISIEIADIALEDIDKIRSSIGSSQNQLESTISNLSTTKINIAASESAIRDVDFAEESKVYAQMSVLAQASTFALAQANEVQKEMLQQLLQ